MTNGQEILVLLTMVTLTACGISNFGRMLPSEKNHWVKPNYTERDIERILYKECGYDNNNWRAVQERVDLCMLKKGFQFVGDKDWDGSVCDIEPRKSFPSCQSLQK